MTPERDRLLAEKAHMTGEGKLAPRNSPRAQ
jgi:hypothetical protein